MPKTKTSSKRANARNGKRSTSSTKKKGLFSRLNLTSKRSQFIAVILIVAVMGAGWFTYQSFAATKQLYSALAAGSFTGKIVTTGSVTTIKDPSKNHQPVYRLNRGGSIERIGLDKPSWVTEGRNAQYDLDRYNRDEGSYQTTRSKQYRWCFTARLATGSVTTTSVQSTVTVHRNQTFTPRTSLSPKTHKVSRSAGKNPTNEYTKLCTNKFHGNDAGSFTIAGINKRGTANLKIVNQGPSVIEIGYLTLHECTDSTC